MGNKSKGNLREEEIQAIRKIIEKSEDLFTDDVAKAIAINSPWGTGKTKFIDSLIEDLKNDNNIKVIKFNAWESDYFEHPILPLTKSIVTSIRNSSNTNDGLKGRIDDFLEVEGNWKALVGIAKIISNSFLGKVKLDTVKEVAEFIYNENISDTKKLEKQINRLNNVQYDLIASIRNFFSAISASIENGKIVVLIDELDRCRPNFAIELLEVVKHLYSPSKNIIFIFSVDMEQIKHSIATIYGVNMDSYGYLRRFFTYILDLPEIPLDSYIELKYNEIIKDKVSSSGNIKILIDELFNKVPGKEKLTINPRAPLYRIYRELNLSLRDLDIIIQNTILFLTITKYRGEIDNTKEDSSNSIEEDTSRGAAAYKNNIKLAIALIAIKYKDPLRYKNISKEIETSEKGSIFGSEYRDRSAVSKLCAIKEKNESTDECINRVKRSIEILNVDSINKVHNEVDNEEHINNTRLDE